MPPPPPPETPATEHQNEPVTERPQQEPSPQPETGSTAPAPPAAAPKPPPVPQESGHSQRVAVGRIVYYVATDRHIRPAIITQVSTSLQLVNLHVFRDGSLDPSAHDFRAVPIHVPYDGDVVPGPGTWHWPPHI